MGTATDACIDGRPWSTNENKTQKDTSAPRLIYRGAPVAASARRFSSPPRTNVLVRHTTERASIATRVLTLALRLAERARSIASLSTNLSCLWIWILSVLLLIVSSLERSSTLPCFTLACALHDVPGECCTFAIARPLDRVKCKVKFTFEDNRQPRGVSFSHLVRCGRSAELEGLLSAKKMHRQDRSGVRADGREQSGAGVASQTQRCPSSFEFGASPVPDESRSRQVRFSAATDKVAIMERPPPQVTEGAAVDEAGYMEMTHSRSTSPHHSKHKTTSQSSQGSVDRYLSEPATGLAQAIARSHQNQSRPRVGPEHYEPPQYMNATNCSALEEPEVIYDEDISDLLEKNNVPSQQQSVNPTYSQAGAALGVTNLRAAPVDLRDNLPPPPPPVTDEPEMPTYAPVSKVEPSPLKRGTSTKSADSVLYPRVSMTRSMSKKGYEDTPLHTYSPDHDTASKSKKSLQDHIVCILVLLLAMVLFSMGVSIYVLMNWPSKDSSCGCPNSPTDTTKIIRQPG